MSDGLEPRWTVEKHPLKSTLSLYFKSASVIAQ